ncbi:MAG: transposase [Candidatus Omnitrophota bacterium]|jgi:putative transposase|nr:MAG: transposase [Candidatus Omnitrophota bacterium]
MPEYRRFKQPNSCYFFTVVTNNRNSILTAEVSRRCLRDAFQTVRKKYPFTIDGIVLLPNHIHTLWSLPEGDSNFSIRWNLIKNRFTKLYIKNNPPTEALSVARSKKREQGVWQRRFWEHLIRNEDDFIKHLDYIHYNPVKHGYVKNPVDWEWSSFHRYVQLKWYEQNWGSQEPGDRMDTCAGE